MRSHGPNHHSGVLDEEIERLAKEQKRRKKKPVAAVEDDATQPAPRQEVEQADHALNFHLRDCSLNDGSDIFVLPPDETEMAITLLSEDRSVAGAAGDGAQYKSEVKNGNAKTPTKKEDDAERARFDSVTSMLTKMQAFREEEAELVKQLANAQPKDNGMTTSLSVQERQDLEDRLEQCRAKQTQQVVASVTDYKPRFKASGKSAKSSSLTGNRNKSPSDLGLSLPDIEDILESAMAEAVPIGGKKDAKKSMPADKPKAKPSNKQVKKTSTTSTTKGTPLTLNYRDVAGTKDHVLNDPLNLLTVHELSIEDPKSRRPEPTARTTLSSLVKSNTRPLDAMEMGRRHKK